MFNYRKIVYFMVRSGWVRKRYSLNSPPGGIKKKPWGLDHAVAPHAAPSSDPTNAACNMQAWGIYEVGLKKQVSSDHLTQEIFAVYNIYGMESIQLYRD